MACTLEALNKNPVTASAVDAAQLIGGNACKKSLPSAVGTSLNPTQPTSGGPHQAPNFRSDHSNGGNFLFCDGSVHYLADNIDMLVYQELSTMMGNDPVQIPDN